MSPHYDRHANGSESVVAQRERRDSAGDDAMDDAAEALREVEVEAAQPEASAQTAVDVSLIDASQLERTSIDELRAIAAALDVPERSKITEQDELIAAIRQRL